MRCTQCGNIIPPDAPRCPVCGARADNAQMQGNQRVPGSESGQSMPPGGREFGYSAEEHADTPHTYATPAFHTYRTQKFTAFPQSQQAEYQGHARSGFSTGGGFVNALSDLPQVVRETFQNPTEALRGMIRREDRFTGGMLVVLSLVFAFFAGMILTKGILGILFAGMSGLTGLQLADSAASLNQGVSFLAGKVAVPVGGVAAACQLIAAVVPAAVAMVYLSVFRQVRFSFLLLSGFAAVITLPNLLALVLASACSLITPYLSLLMLLFGQVYSYILLCTMAAQIGEVETPRTVPAQALLVCLSEFVKIILIAVIGGMLMRGVIQTLASLTNSMEGLL